MPSPKAQSVEAPPVDVPQVQTVYRLLVQEDAPFDTVTLGGQAFSKQTEDIRFDQDGKTQRIPIAGAITPLFPDELALVQAKMDGTRVRWVSRDHKRAILIDTRVQRTLESDEPISRYVSIQPVT